MRTCHSRIIYNCHTCRWRRTKRRNHKHLSFVDVVLRLPTPATRAGPLSLSTGPPIQICKLTCHSSWPKLSVRRSSSGAVQRRAHHFKFKTCPFSQLKSMSDDTFVLRTHEFLNWFKRQPGTSFHNDIEIADLRSKGAGRGISEYLSRVCCSF